MKSVLYLVLTVHSKVFTIEMFTNVFSNRNQTYFPTLQCPRGLYSSGAFTFYIENKGLVNVKA